MVSPVHVHWKDEPDEHDYPAALEYLSLLVDPVVAEEVVRRLRDQPPCSFKAKDLLRASGLDLLPPDDPQVKVDLERIHRGHRLSPVLLVRGQLGRFPLVVADGYHRICASYHVDENQEIRCRLGALEAE
jgi:hypothetical protein